MALAFERPNAHLRDSMGATLLELTIALLAFGMLSALAIPACMRSVAVGQLTLTATDLAAHLRFAQAASQADGLAAMVRLAPFTPMYQTFRAGRLLDTVTFGPGVLYKDGYLQMTTGMVAFDLLGNAQTAGVIRLTNEGGEQDVTLYMGAGFSSLGGLAHEFA